LHVTVLVFLVEDVLQLRGVVSELLASLGDFRIVGEVATEAEAKLWLDENRGRWDLAVVDLILEQGTGMGVIAKCKEEPGAKVVVFSDYATPGIRKHCLKLGADAVFQKSNDVPAFIAWCSALLDPTAPRS
jgi:DNA-binding NarL/FixJ family response regulator